MNKIELCGQHKENCTLQHSQEEIEQMMEYPSQKLEMMEIDNVATICGYFIDDDDIVGYHCDNPFNETFDEKLGFGECNQFDCPFCYVACKKDYIFLEPEEYEQDKEHIDEYSDQPYGGTVVLMEGLIESDLIRHFYKNYNWTNSIFKRNWGCF